MHVNMVKNRMKIFRLRLATRTNKCQDNDVGPTNQFSTIFGSFLLQLPYVGLLLVNCILFNHSIEYESNFSRDLP